MLQCCHARADARAAVIVGVSGVRHGGAGRDGGRMGRRKSIKGGAGEGGREEKGGREKPFQKKEREGRENPFQMRKEGRENLFRCQHRFACMYV